MGLCTSNVKYFAWFIVLGLDWLTQINHQQLLGLDLVSSIQQHLETSTEFENAHHNTTMYNYLYQPKPPQKLKHLWTTTKYNVTNNNKQGHHNKIHNKNNNNNNNYNINNTINSFRSFRLTFVDHN